MRHAHPIRHTPHTFRGAAARMRHARPVRHTSHTFRGPTRELHRRPLCRRPHASPTPNSATPSSFVAPQGSSTEGPGAAARMRHAHPIRHA
eukprot:7389665-Pyramimonas_sp.AAC.1